MSDIFNIVIGTAGHIDHGKSSLVKSLTGIDPDRLKEEKERGLTIDLGFAPLLLPDGRKVGIIDVPGHERFIKNMVAGATSIDFVILVIAADDSIMPQTREHLEIMQILGIEKGMVAMTKIDVVDAELVSLAYEEIRDFLKGTFLEHSPIVGLSNLTGQGLPEFRQVLFEQLQTVAPKETTGIFRMPIQRVFSKHGHGTVITGVPVSGSIGIGDEIEIVPGQYIGRVKKIQAYGMPVELACAGHSTALNVKDIDYKDIVRGQVAVMPGYFDSMRFLEARFQYLASAEKPLEHLTPIRFHAGTLEETGHIAILGKKELMPGEIGYIQIRLDNPVLVVTGDRFVLRLASPMITIGGGIIIGSGERKLKRFREEVVAQLQEKEQILENKEARFENMLQTVSTLWAKESELLKLSQLPKEEYAQILQTLISQGNVRMIPGSPNRYIHTLTLEKVQRQILTAMGQFFMQYPHRIYAQRLDIRNLLHWEIGLLDYGIAELLHTNQMGENTHGLFLPNREIRFSNQQAEWLAKLEALFLERKFNPPDMEELPLMMMISGEKLMHLLEHLHDKEILTMVLPEMFFHVQALQEAREKVIAYIQQHGELTAGDFRDQLNTSRKYVIPLLEYFDQIGLTSRQGNSRILRTQ